MGLKEINESIFPDAHPKYIKRILERINKNPAASRLLEYNDEKQEVYLTEQGIQTRDRILPSKSFEYVLQD